MSSRSPSSPSVSTRRLSAPRRIQSPARRKTNFFHSLQADSAIDIWTSIAQKTDDKTIDASEAEDAISVGIKNKLHDLLTEIDETAWIYDNNRFG